MLDHDIVRYESADVIAATLEYEFDRERRFDYKGLSLEETVIHIVRYLHISLKAPESELAPLKREQVGEQVRGQEKSKVVEEIKSRQSAFAHATLPPDRLGPKGEGAEVVDE